MAFAFDSRPGLPSFPRVELSRTWRLTRGRRVESDDVLDACRPAQDQVRRLLRWVAAGDERSDYSGQRRRKASRSRSADAKASGPALTVPSSTWFLSTMSRMRRAGSASMKACRPGDAGQHEDAVGAQHLQRMQGEVGLPDRLVDQVDVAYLRARSGNVVGLGGGIGRADGVTRSIRGLGGSSRE